MTQANVDAWTAVQREFRDHVPRVPAEKAFHRAAVSTTARRGGRVAVSVANMDTLDAALRLFSAEEDPLVLVFADPERPGGCVAAGAGMQEESLFRRTALFRYLDRSLYPIEPLAAIYAPDVPLSAALGSASGQRRSLSFVACPGVRMPPTGPDGRLLEFDAALMKRKIELVFQVARDNGHASLVLGALGCGVFGCPPRHVAELFREVLESDAVAFAFRRVVFAVTGANRRFFEEGASPLEPPSIG